MIAKASQVPLQLLMATTTVAALVAVVFSPEAAEAVDSKFPLGSGVSAPLTRLPGAPSVFDDPEQRRPHLQQPRLHQRQQHQQVDTGRRPAGRSRRHRSRRPSRPARAVGPMLNKILLDKDTGAVCNDGSRAGYYFRPSPTNSSKWLVYLEGGWYCFDEPSCRLRWRIHRELMTSIGWNNSFRGEGILSPDSDLNPPLWDANHVYVPYCSSDGWSGSRQRPAGADHEFWFMGRVIVTSVIDDLLRGPLPGGPSLATARLLLLAGSSAGGVGVLVNVDRVADQLASAHSEVKVRALVDSAWFIDRDPLRSPKTIPCSRDDAHNCLLVDMINNGRKLWQSQPPARCMRGRPAADAWKCYLADNLYPTILTPSFIVQWRYDTAQMRVDNVQLPESPSQWQFVYESGEELLESLKNVSNVFVPACVAHTTLLRPEWFTIKIGDTDLAQALQCWIRNEMADAPKTRRSNRRRARANAGKRRPSRRAATRTQPDRLSRSPSDARRPRDAQDEQPRCRARHIDRCQFPQCNLSCPGVYDPYTGREQTLVDLLVKFGADLDNISSTVGVPVDQMYDMNRTALLMLINSADYVTPK